MFEKIGQGKFEQISFILNYVESELVLEENAEMHASISSFIMSYLFNVKILKSIPRFISLIQMKMRFIHLCLKQTMRCETCGLSNLISNLIRFILAL